MKFVIRPPSLHLAAAFALLTVSIVLTGSFRPMPVMLIASAALLGTMPFWSTGENRLSLDKVAIAGLFVTTGTETAYILSLFTVIFTYSLYDYSERRDTNRTRTALEGILSPSIAFALASAFRIQGWVWLLALYFAVYLGDIISQALSQKLPRTLLRAPSWGAAFILSAPFALIVTRNAADGGLSATAMLLTSAVAFSALSKMRLDSHKNYSRLASETAVQNSLAAELSAASSVGQYLGLLEAYLENGASEVTILTRPESGQGWIGWMENRQFTVNDEELPAGMVPDPGRVRDDFSFNGVIGALLGLSRVPDMLLFAPGRGGFTLSSMDPSLARNLVSLISHSWRAVGHSMAIEEAFIAAAMMLARLADSKDDYTHGHSVRVSRISQLIGHELELSGATMRTLKVGALLHDLGKVAIPVEILTKRGLLTREERAVIERHPAEGTRILGTLGGYDEVRSIVQSHHERLDGKGYPAGLSGRAIPFTARIVAVADTFDAITTRRSYRADSDINTALDAIRAGAGTQFDSRIVSAFIRILHRGELHARKSG